jgi:Taurine catabolism dioxygenase TauD, TfdA family
MLTRTDWIHSLTTTEVNEVRTAVARIEQSGREWLTLTRADFPLPRVTERLASVRQALEHGCGMAVVRGLPADALGLEGLRIALWGLGLHLGTAVSQSKFGELLAEVRDYGETVGQPTSRGYRTGSALRFHTDRCDVVALACVRQCREGGDSLTVSTPHLHNVLLAKDPAALDLLYGDWYHSHQGEELPGQPRHYRNPIFAQHRGRFTSQYSRTYVESASKFSELPAPTEAHWKALDLLAQTAHDECFISRMEPGDIQLLNNHVTYHSRSSVVDWDEPERKRMLFRLWLATPESRELPADFDELWGPTAAGAVRGGVVARAGYRTTAELLALRSTGRAPARAGWPLESLPA